MMNSSKEPQKKARIGFLLKLLLYTASVSCIFLFVGGRTDHLFKSERNKAALPALLQNDFPGRKKLLEDFQAYKAGSTDTELRSLEKFILARVPWESDWRNWGVREYIPTPQEILDRGKEDCDGRAILFVNLARALGHPHINVVWAQTHVWAMDGKGEHYLLYAPGNYAETGAESPVEIPTGEDPGEEPWLLSDSPPEQTLHRSFKEQFHRDLMSMEPTRIYRYMIASAFLAAIALFLPKGSLQNKKKA